MTNRLPSPRGTPRRAPGRNHAGFRLALLGSLALVGPFPVATGTEPAPLPGPVPAGAPGRSAPSSAPSSAATFAVNRYEVTGSSVLDPQAVNRLMQSAIGPAVSLPQISHALRRLREAYRNQGLARVTVTLPRQPLTNGTVQLHVALTPGAPGPSPADPPVPPVVTLPAYQVRHWLVRGNTALSAEEIDLLIGPDTGAPLAIPEVRTILSRLREAYRERGYPAASLTVPQQLLTDGTVTLEVVEGSRVALASAPVSLPSAPAPPSPAAPPAPTFEVRRYEVTGNTVLRQETIDAIFTNAVGAAVSLPRVQEALGALQLAYRERGFATVSVGLPRQQLTNATVKVQVTEGLLTDIQVTGQRYFSSNNVRRALPSLHTNELLNARVFQRELDLANQNRDRQIYPTLGPGPEPGTSALTLRVQDRLPLHGRLEVNNLSTPGTPDWRINASAQYNNLWQREHQLGVSYAFSPEAWKSGNAEADRLLDAPLIASYGAYYRLPLGDPEPIAGRLTPTSGFGYDEATRQFRLPPAGNRPDLTFFASASTSDTGIQYGPATVVSRTPLLTIVSQDTGQNLSENLAAGARFSYPFAPTENRRLALGAGPDWKSFRLASFNTNNFIITTVVTNSQGSQTIESRVASPQPPRENQVDYLPLTVSADYSRTDASGLTSASLALSYNVLGDSEDFAALAYSREARADFGRALLQLAREQKLPREWLLNFRAAGQFATGALISNEQFAVGGLQSVRGYYEGDEYGDAGWFASGELRTPFLPARFPTFSDFVPVWLRAWAFLDFGQRLLLEPPPGLDSTGTLAGTGFGVSANLNNRFDLRITVGWPLFDTLNTPAGDPRAYLTFGGQF